MKTQIMVTMSLLCSITIHSSTTRQIQLLDQPLLHLYGSCIQERSDQSSSTDSLYNISPSSNASLKPSAAIAHRTLSDVSIIVSPQSSPDQEIDQHPEIISTDPQIPPHAIVHIPERAQNNALYVQESRCECVFAYLKYITVMSVLGTCIGIHLYNLDHHKRI